MRDYQYKSTQYLQGKGWDATTPVGPYLVTPDEILDLRSLTLTTTVNGATVQEASTAQMIFDVPTLVSTISEFMALAPGDLILTGTPSGVGFRREPQLLLDDGDLVVCEIDGIGRLENRVVSER
jgi:acylpyruvate hydrolase